MHEHYCFYNQLASATQFYYGVFLGYVGALVVYVHMFKYTSLDLHFNLA